MAAPGIIVARTETRSTQKQNAPWVTDPRPDLSAFPAYWCISP